MPFFEKGQIIYQIWSEVIDILVFLDMYHGQINLILGILA